MTDALLAGLASFGVLAAVFVPLERLFPARSGQPVLRPAFALDAVFFFGQYLLWNAAALAVLGGVAEAAGPAFPAGLWEIPVWASAPASIVAGDLLVYAFHRACHRFDLLWQFHSIHHSSEHLDWLAAHREHPVDGILTQLCQNLPAIVLGVPMYVLAPVAVFRGMWAVFVHSNVRLPLGPLRWLLGAPELHHWHHARVERAEHNFANLAPWIDVLFGTHHLPQGPESYPLGLGTPAPRGYVRKLLSPLVPRIAVDDLRK
jgi:sterol desaturase/sphingolipid hydroxylase (fatty acid hydroxylase superfamily)